MSLSRARYTLLFAAFVAGPALAQQPPAASGTTSPAAGAQATPPAAGSTGSATPAPATSPAAGGTTSGAASGASTPGTSSQSAAPQAGDKAETQLPTVKVIQEKPKPKPVIEEAPKPKKPKPVEQAAEPVPAPAPKKVAAPKQAPKPVVVAPAAPAPAAAAPAPVEAPQAAEVAPAAGTVEAGYVKMSPIGGSEIPIAKVPGGVATVTAKDVERTGASTIQDALQARVPGIVMGDLQGNSFQTNLQYRGFESSPVNGVPQGLAVYQNGVRINESWGDIVNFDFIPSNAINDISVLSGNPVFGLNAVGGAVSLGMKDGFNYQGGEIDARIGSFGRRQVSAQAGIQSGPFGVYAALERIHDDNFRDFSASNIRRMYADLGAKGSMIEAHVNFTGARNEVGVAGSSGLQLLDSGWNKTFTTPQTTHNEMEMVSGNVAVKPTATLTLSALTYYRRFRQSHVDGNIGEFSQCEDEDGNPLGTLCGDDPDNAFNGGNIAYDPNIVYGSIDRTSTSSGSYGVSLQAVEKSKLFGLGNQFLLGASYDHGKTVYGASSELGYFGQLFVVSGQGTMLTDADGETAPRALNGKNTYTGIYFSDTLDLTSQLALTFGGRFNHAKLDIQDAAGTAPDVTANHTFERFNPMVGATYKVMPGLSVYGGYSEANRAPTPAELSCSDPNHPCIIESFLVADPPLKQVISHTYEAGLRGEVENRYLGSKIDWSLGFFRTENDDDIYSVFSEQAGRGYFTNIGKTLRQGVEAAASYRTDKLFLYGNYSYVDATFQTPLEVASPNNPLNPSPGDPFGVFVAKGSHMPGIPAHRLKLGVDYWLTDAWKVGSDLIVTSSQYYIGDEANQNEKLAGYQRLDLHTSYDLTKNVQLYGIVQNVLDKHYGLTGTYFNLAAAAAPAALNGQTFTDSRSILPAQPFAAYGGLKVKF